MPKSKAVSHKRLDRLQVMLAPEELEVIDNFRFEKRMPSRAAAIREILLRGLAATGFDIASPASRSRDFGVLTNGDAVPASATSSKRGR